MRKVADTTKIFLFATLLLLVLSIVLAVISLYPVPERSNISYVLINDTFQLSPNETYIQGLGSFRGGENITLLVQSPLPFDKNLSIMFPVSNYYFLIKSGTCYCNSSVSNITYSFTASPDYYEAVFTSATSNAGTIHFQAFAQEPKTIYQYSWLDEPSKIMFFVSLGAAILLTLKMVFSTTIPKQKTFVIPSLSKKARKRLLALLLFGLAIWFIILAINSSPHATLENWYTDNARDSYVASLFLKDGFSVFSQPLGKLASLDNSNYEFVTWPQMPHLYPLGSILLFLPFGVLLQKGFDPSLIYKIEIAMFLVFATVSVYFFLKNFLKKDMTLILKLLGVYIIYVTLVAYAADGMFDSVAFFFSLFAIYMFITERYDYFFLLVAVSSFFKYEAGIFLLPLITVGLIKLLQKNKLGSLLRNKAFVAGLIFGFASIFTAYFSVPYLMAAGPQLIMNGINAFAPNTHITWLHQSTFIFLTLGVTVTYAVYMLDKNRLLSLSALFLLLPSFIMPYFQNWYLPFIFLYALVPQRKKELDVTVFWLIFMIAVLAFAGTNFQISL